MKFIAPLYFVIASFSAAAQQTDEILIGKTIERFYRSVSFADSSYLRLDSIKAVFTIDGKLAANFSQNPMSFTVQEYAQNLKRRVRGGEIDAALENEIFRKTDVFGNVAHVLSTYELTMLIKGKPVTRRGVNFLQLLKVNGMWLICSLVWDRKNEKLRVPPKYLSIN